MNLPAWLVMPLGPFIGSWLGVLVRRWPEERGVVLGRSRCAACGHALAASDLVPFLSFILLHGKCRHCRAAIGWFAPGIELSGLAVAAAAYFADGGDAMCWLNAALGWALLLAAWIDWENFCLPDLITLPLILAGLAVTAAFNPASLYNHAAAAALGFAGFWLVNLAYRALRHRDGLGTGDAKLLAAAGAWLGVAALPDVIFFAAALGIALAGSRHASAREAALNQPVPFGPALAVAFFALRLASQATISSPMGFL